MDDRLQRTDRRALEDVRLWRFWIQGSAYSRRGDCCRLGSEFGLACGVLPGLGGGPLVQVDDAPFAGEPHLGSTLAMKTVGAVMALVVGAE